MEPTSGVEGHVDGFAHWLPRATVLEEKVNLLEREEEEVGKLYGESIQSVFLQTCFFITFGSYMVVLFVKKFVAVWMVGFFLSVVLIYVFGVVIPVLFAYRQLTGLKLTRQKLIKRRKKLNESCSMLLEEYNQIYVSEARMGEAEDLKKILTFPIEKLEGFKEEDLVPKFQKKNNRKIVLVIGLCCSIFFAMVVFYAFYIAYYEASGPSPSVPPVSSRGPGAVAELVTRVALRSWNKNDRVFVR